MPENTFASFQRALEIGADMIELDVHPCRDGDLVVMHDETVDRTTDGTGKVSDMDLDEIAGLDAAAKTPLGRREPIPTFAEVLERFADKIPIAVEVKHGSSVYPGVEKRVVQELREHGAERKVELMSFDLECLHKLKCEDPSLTTGFIFTGNMASFAELLKDEVDALHGRWNFLTREQVDRARELGFPSFAWTVNDIETMRVALATGADGMVSNFPDRVLEYLRAARG